MSFRVRFSADAEDDLDRLFDFLLDRARTIEDVDRAQITMEAVRHAVLQQLGVTPYSFRKTGKSSTRRELIIPHGATGYVAFYEIETRSDVLVLAIRHQREEDYH